MAEEDIVSASGFPQFSAQLLQRSRQRCKGDKENQARKDRGLSLLYAAVTQDTEKKAIAHGSVQTVLSFRSQRLLISAEDLPHTPRTGGECSLSQTLLSRH